MRNQGRPLKSRSYASEVRTKVASPWHRARRCLYLGLFSPGAAIMIATVLLTFAARGQQSVRTPDVPPFTTFAPNPEEATFLRAGPFSGTGELGVGYLYTDNANTTDLTKLSMNEVFENLG